MSEKDITEVKKEYIKCPHCKGYTTCVCGSCQTFVVGAFTGDKITYPGICKVCNGTGRIEK